MKIEGQYLFENAPSDAVWNFVTNPDRIVLCLPGCEKLVPMGNETYEMSMRIGVGAIKGTFTGSIRLRDIHPTTDYGMTVAGSGTPGFVNGDGAIRLVPHLNGTEVHYSGEVNAGGPIASVGQRMIGGAARMVIEQFFKCVSENLQNGEVHSNPKLV